MCRLYGFRANEPTKVECSLVLAQNALLTQSRSDLAGRTHEDGWGIATYEDSVPVVEKRETAAFETTHFSTVAERAYTQTVVAHIRRATVSGPSLTNTHPFTHGVWTFAHNGTLQAYDRLAPVLEEELPVELRAARLGGTDSELMFLWLLGRMKALGISTERPCREPRHVADLVARSIAELVDRTERAGAEKPSQLNFLLTDGRSLVASRWRNSLFWTRREGVQDCEVCGIPHVHHGEGVPYRAVVVASEPITHEEWTEVRDGETVVVYPDLRSELIEAT